MSPHALETIETILPGMVGLRHDIHRHPDLSGQEQATASRLLEYLKPACPDYIHRNIGGHGVAVVFSGTQGGPTTLFSCELDALCRQVDHLVADIAANHDLEWKCWPENRIPIIGNHDQAVDALLAAAEKAGLPTIELELPQGWSDDFGVLTQHYTGTFFGMGSGTACGQLHGPDFDYPDAILKPALLLYWVLVESLHGVVNDCQAIERPKTGH